jgi:hypothetical protein
VRASFGLYNTEAEVDRALGLLAGVAEGKYVERYQSDGPSGRFLPPDGEPDYTGRVRRFFASLVEPAPPVGGDS